MFNVNEFISNNRDPYGLTPRSVFLQDGTELSIQASSRHYCTPKSDIGPYLSVEVMGTLPGHFDGCDAWGIYGWVPVEMLEEYINQVGVANGPPAPPNDRSMRW